MDPLSKPGLPPGLAVSDALPLLFSARAHRAAVGARSGWSTTGGVDRTGTRHARGMGPLRALSALEMAALLPPKAECHFEDGQRAENRTLDLSAIDVWARLAEVSRAGRQAGYRHSGHRGGAAADRHGRGPSSPTPRAYWSRSMASAAWRSWQAGGSRLRSCAGWRAWWVRAPSALGRTRLCLHLNHCPHPCWCVSHRRHRCLHLRLHLHRQSSQRRSPMTLRARARPNVRGGFR